MKQRERCRNMRWDIAAEYAIDSVPIVRLFSFLQSKFYQVKRVIPACLTWIVVKLWTRFRKQNLRRFTRLTNGFSKKLDTLKPAVALHFARYNMVRIHKTLRVTPAMAAGVSDRLWTLQELVEEASK